MKSSGLMWCATDRVILMISLSHLASFSELLTPSVISGSRFNGNNILDSSPCGLRVDWSYVRVFSWFALQMNHENQTRKSHEPGITKRHRVQLMSQVCYYHLPKGEGDAVPDTDSPDCARLSARLRS